jgi:hypothetical protein
LIDPKLKESGWGVADGSKILREYPITAGKIQTDGGRAKRLHLYLFQKRRRTARDLVLPHDAQDIA